MTNIDAALAEHGFVNGKYGELPFILEAVPWMPDQDNVESCCRILVDGRQMGRVIGYTDHTYKVELDIANWMNPRRVSLWGTSVLATFPINDAVAKYSDMKFKRYPIFDRAKERAKIALALEEDEKKLKEDL